MNMAKTFLALVAGFLCSPSFAVSAPKHKYIPDGYRIETITTPANVRFHITGLDTHANGDVYVATRLGEVWAFSQGKWTRFADGLHEPTGLLVDSDNSIVVGQKPELTRLIDTDNDGIADDYIRLGSGWEFHDNYHEFNFGPVKDRKGNYYGTLNLGHMIPNGFSLGTMASAGGYRGFAYQINAKGEFKPFAWGLRSPAGIGKSPKGEIFYTDNQGDWVATSKLHLLEQNKFYGHPVSLRDIEGFTLDRIRKMSLDELEGMTEKPVVWIPHIEVANSPGNPEWDTTNGKFGPFKNQIFIGDQTQSNIIRVMLEKINGQYQGAVINFINRFQSGNIRVDFDKQGQLWVGQTARGWGAKGKKPFGLEKVVWDGTTPFELLDMQLTKTGFKLNFTDEIDPSSVTIDNLVAEQWHYLYHGKYGSPKQDMKSVPLSQITLSKDKKTIEVTMPLEADKVVAIKFDGIRQRNGREPSTRIVYYTLNHLLK